MNKLCLRLLNNSIKIKCQNLLKSNSNLYYSFASFKQYKGSKNTQNKNNQNTSKNQILKTTKTMQKNQQKIISKKQTEPRGVLTEQQRKSLTFQQKIKATYSELQSLPSDSYQTVVQNFKRIKQKLNDRKVYVPNKPELLIQLDKSMQFVKKHHNVWRAPSTAPERRLSDSKSQVIQWELQQAKTKYYLSLLENQKVLIGIASSLVLLFVGLQYFYFIKKEEDKSKQIPKMFI